MIAIILAAGIGRRMRPLTDGIPKALVEVRGKPLLVHQLDNLVDCGIDKIVIVIGYKKELILNRIGNSYRGVPVEYVINDDYATTNNIYSLWLARDHLNTDVIIMECDILFEKEVLSRILKDEEPNVILVDRYRLGMDGTVVRLNVNNGLVDRIITRTQQSETFDFSTAYKTINIYKFSKDFLAQYFVPALSFYIQSRGTTSYYELVLGVLTYLGYPIKAVSAEGLKWHEIDDVNDLQKAEYLFCSQEEKLEFVKKLYGGYWRHDFADFCYLSNPYFPPPSMISEMKYRLHSLISNYPSGQEELDRLISRMFNVPSRNIVVANGASQLIQIFNKTIATEARIAIPLPAFNEFERTLDKNQIVPYLLEDKQFRLLLPEYASFIREQGVQGAILINPNNPTGWAVKKDELIKFLDSIQNDVKFFIIDESFTDFVAGAGENTLLRQEILDKYPFVVIIRSLSKEFGIAGLRLGFLASGDTDLVDEIRKELPIWNINSLAECFMELFLKYRDEYVASCQKIVRDREILFNRLKEIPFLKLYPTFANFVFCEVRGDWTASLLTDRLFLDHNIFIKNCGNRSGLNPDKYVRIASKTPPDNERLLNALHGLASVKRKA